MRYGSVCSGIEAATVAWRHLGWECAFVSEIDAFASAVLKERLPAVPNLGDFTKIRPGDYGGDIDLLVGGTPCQAFSKAGLRKGLEDERGNLALEFAGLAFRTHARWVVWENVPGVLSSGGGRDFAIFLSKLAGWRVPVPKGGWKKAGLLTGAPGCFSVGWRVLDAQYTRVQQFPRAIPQRRKRLVLAGHLGDWGYVRGVFFDGEMCGGYSPPGRDKEGSAAKGTGGGSCECIPLDLTNLDGRTRHLKGKCYDDVVPSAYTITRRRPSGVCVNGKVRMLTPVECERAMGFPDGYTSIAWHGRDAAHCPRWSRYRALGNTMNVNVMAWVGERIDAVDKENFYGRQQTCGTGGEDARTAEGGRG